MQMCLEFIQSEFGDKIVNARIRRTIHGKVQTVLKRFCLPSSIRAECEVFGAFRDLIPVQALGEEGLQRGRVDRDSYLTSKWSCPLPRVSQQTG